MTEPDPDQEQAPAELPKTDQKSRVPQRPEQTDAAGDSLNGVGEDNHHKSGAEND